MATGQLLQVKTTTTTLLLGQIGERMPLVVGPRQILPSRRRVADIVGFVVRSRLAAEAISTTTPHSPTRHMIADPRG